MGLHSKKKGEKHDQSPQDQRLSNQPIQPSNHPASQLSPPPFWLSLSLSLSLSLTHTHTHTHTERFHRTPGVEGIDEGAVHHLLVQHLMQVTRGGGECEAQDEPACNKGMREMGCKGGWITD
jgi:hypothetical protein